MALLGGLGTPTCLAISLRWAGLRRDIQRDQLQFSIGRFASVAANVIADRQRLKPGRLLIALDFRLGGYIKGALLLPFHSDAFRPFIDASDVAMKRQAAAGFVRFGRWRAVGCD